MTCPAWHILAEEWWTDSRADWSEKSAAVLRVMSDPDDETCAVYSDARDGGDRRISCRVFCDPREQGAAMTACAGFTGHPKLALLCADSLGLKFEYDMATGALSVTPSWAA